MVASLVLAGSIPSDCISRRICSVAISAVKVDILGLRELAVHNTVVAINLVWG